MSRPNIHQLLNHFGRQENAFLQTEFIAPKLRGVQVAVRIGGAVCSMQTSPADYEGFGVFRPESHTMAMFVRDATLAERGRYMDLLPRVKLIAHSQLAQKWVGCIANGADRRVCVDGLVPIHLALDIELFDVLYVRFDGQRFWFDRLDVQTDPRLPAELRASLESKVHPSELSVVGLTPALRAAYEVNYQRRYEPMQSATRKDWTIDVGDQLRNSLSHAGGELVGYAEHDDGYRVTYNVDGRQHVSSIDKVGFTVQSAGFCLDGMDRDFDLASLVSVAREGNQTNQIYDED